MLFLETLMYILRIVETNSKTLGRIDHFHQFFIQVYFVYYLQNSKYKNVIKLKCFVQSVYNSRYFIIRIWIFQFSHITPTVIFFLTRHHGRTALCDIVNDFP